MSRGQYFNPRAPCGARLYDTTRHIYIGSFQSTRPLRGATLTLLSNEGVYAINFNPRAPCGARQRKLRLFGRRQDFNPRAPCGARLSTPLHQRLPFPISIHAPLAGRDRSVFPFSALIRFQSTRPLRGATLDQIAARISTPRISIHAPLAGRDTNTCIYIGNTTNFNPRAPCGARPVMARSYNQYKPFQSTRPLRGATAVGDAGCVHSRDFNPRAPCGARRPADRRARPRAISIHAPLAGRDTVKQHMTRSTGFQSTRPLRGATSLMSVTQPRRPAFQSTRPLRGATRLQVAQAVQRAISIHAPLAGRDIWAYIVAGFTPISIHAPLAGRDIQLYFFCFDLKNFNPRAPCGARLSGCIQFHHLRGISIHAPLAGRDHVGRAECLD